MSLEVVGMMSKVIFESDRGDYVVAEFIDADSARRFRASGKILTLGKKEAQQLYRLFGEWQNTAKYGATFSVVYSEPVRPNTIKGIIPFLANNVRGIGEATAKKLIDTLGIKGTEDLIVICREEPQRIYEFFKSKRATAEAVISAITGDEIYRSIMIFLHEHNIATNFARRIYDRYHADSVRLLKENPYRLITDFRNVGFLKADAIALKIGIPPNSPFRIEAAFLFALEVACDEGHCCLPRDVLVERAREVLSGGKGQKDPQFSFEYVLSQLRAIYKRNKDAGTEKFVLRQVAEPSSPGTSQTLAQTPQPAPKGEMLFYLPDIYALENKVAGMCLSLLSVYGIGAEHLEKSLRDSLQNELPDRFLASEASLESPDLLKKILPELPWDKLSPEQRDAVEKSASARFMILTGGPGCGKTFVLKSIYKLQRALNRRVALCAPTGLAAKRMTLSIEAQASTLHKALRIGQVKEKHATQNKEGAEVGSSESAGSEEAGTSMGEGALENVDVVIVDEASMLSLDLFHALLDALGPSRRLILVGDVDQLPSIGAGNCLRDLIGSGEVPLVRLTKIFRQSSESPIPLAAREIIAGRPPEFTAALRSPAFVKPEPFAMIYSSPQEFPGMLLEFLRVTVPHVYKLDPVRDCQILVPIRRGDVGQDSINRLLQAELNPPQPDKEECQIGHDYTLRVGDKVIQTRNNYDKDVFNGDLGYCVSIRKTSEKLEVDIRFDEKIVRLEDDEVDDLQLCYAMTVHKSQGSEFPLCIIPLFNAYYNMLDRNLLYTAVTRASRFAVLMGESWPLKRAVTTSQAVKRYTSLDALVKNGMEAIRN